jgi:arsenate reductase (thioredoxin)
MVTVLFICIHNAGRSQIAEAFFNKLSEGRYNGISAGSSPADTINPVVIEAMSEVGIDLNGKRPKKLSKELILKADLAITMGCGQDACPIVPNEVRDWDLEDPHGKSIEVVREIRDEIRNRVEALISELNDAPLT